MAMQILILPLLLFSSAAPSANKPTEQCDAKPFALSIKPTQKTTQPAKPVVPKAVPVKKTTATKPLADCKIPAKK